MGGRGKEFVCWRGLRFVAANLPIDCVHMFLDSLRRNLGNKLKGVERNVLPRTVNAHLTVGEVYGKNSAGYQCCGAPAKKMKKMTTNANEQCARFLMFWAERAAHALSNLGPDLGTPVERPSCKARNVLPYPLP